MSIRLSPESGGSVPAGVLPGRRSAQAALSGHASSLLNHQSRFFTHHPRLPAPRPAPSLAHLAKVPEGCRASFTELHDQRDGAQQDAWGQGGAVNGGPGHGTDCVCAPPLSREWVFLICFSRYFRARPEVDGGGPCCSYHDGAHGAVWHKVGGRCWRVRDPSGSCAQRPKQPAEIKGQIRLHTSPTGQVGNTFWRGTCLEVCVPPSSAHRGWAAGAASPPQWRGLGTSQRSPWRSECTGPDLELLGSLGSGHCRVWKDGQSSGRKLVLSSQY